MFNFDGIKSELEDYVEGWAQYYDLGNIVSTIWERYPECQSIDEIDADELQQILQDNDKNSDTYLNPTE